MNRRLSTKWSKGIRLRLAVALSLTAVVIGWVVWQSIGPFGRVQWTYRLKQRRLEEIVARIRTLDIQTDRSRYLSVDRSLNAASLREQRSSDDPYDSSIVKIAVHRDASRDYFIEFVLEDQGHSGMFGLIFSDATVSYLDASNRRIAWALYLIDAAQPIDKHWWYAYNTEL